MRSLYPLRRTLYDADVLQMVARRLQHECAMYIEVN